MLRDPLQPVPARDDKPITCQDRLGTNREEATFCFCFVCRDARIFATLRRGVEQEKRLLAEDAAAEEAGEYASYLTQPQRRRQQQIAMEQALAEKARVMRQTERTAAASTRRGGGEGQLAGGSDASESGDAFVQPVEAMNAALAMLVQRSSPTPTNSQNNRRSIRTAVGSSRLSGNSRGGGGGGGGGSSTDSIGSSRSGGGLEENDHDPRGFLSASLLFTESLNAQLYGLGSGGPADTTTGTAAATAAVAIKRPDLLELSGRKQQEQSVWDGGGDSSGDSGSEGSLVGSPMRKRPQRPRSAGRVKK